MVCKKMTKFHSKWDRVRVEEEGPHQISQVKEEKLPYFSCRLFTHNFCLCHHNSYCAAKLTEIILLWLAKREEEKEELGEEKVEKEKEQEKLEGGMTENEERED